MITQHITIILLIQFLPSNALQILLPLESGETGARGGHVHPCHVVHGPEHPDFVVHASEGLRALKQLLAVVQDLKRLINIDLRLE